MKKILLPLLLSFCICCATQKAAVLSSTPPVTVEVIPPQKAPVGSCEASWKVCVPKLTLTEDVTQVSVQQVLEGLDRAQEQKAQAVVLQIDSHGGDTEAGFRLVRAIEASPFPVLCVVDGAAYSMAFYLLQACTVRMATQGSTLMAHEPRLGGLLSGTREFYLELAEQLRMSTRKLAWLAARRMGITPAEFEAKIANRNWWMTTEEALKEKALDQVVQDVQQLLTERRAGSAK